MRPVPIALCLILLTSMLGMAAPAPHIDAVLNGASFGQAVAGGLIASLFGENLATSLQVAGGPPYPTSLGNISLTVAGYPAPLFAVSPTQIDFQVPWEAMGQNQTTIQLTVAGVATSAALNLAPFAPGLFSTNSQGTGQGAVLIASAGAALAAPAGAFPGSRPALPGEYLEIYATGLGPVGYGPATGQAAASVPPATTLATPEVTLGGVAAKLVFSGLAPGFAGLYQANIQVPANAPSGDAVDLKMSIPGGATSNDVTVAVGPTPLGSVSVTLKPSAAPVQIGNTLSFTASVTGNTNTAVIWAIDDPSHGSIDSQGNYHAPASVPPGGFAVVTATSAADSTKYASALVTITGASGKPSITVSPQDGTVILGGTRQFTATVTGTSNTAVTWTATGGSINATGLFTAVSLGGPFSGQVTATLQEDPTVTASAYFYPVTPPPVLTGLSPSSAAVGQQVQLLGQSVDDSNLTVYFTGPNGVLIPEYPDGQPIVVPIGATTGPVYVEARPDDLSTVRSNGVLFTRQPRLLLHAGQNDLAAGEGVQVAARFLGSGSPQPLDWTADQGMVDTDGNYTAPASLQVDGFAHVTACLEGTQSCDTVVLGLHPFRITPAEPQVQAGATLQLSALASGAHIVPVWSVQAGGGSLMPNGLFTAPSDLMDSGGIPISATYQGLSEKSAVAVTNSFPGMVNRAYQFSDYSSTSAPMRYARSVEVSGNRAYVISGDAQLYFGATDWWMEIYDVSDPSHPVWLDAVEMALTGSQVSLDPQNQLLAQVDQYQYPNRLAIYDLQSGSPVLISLVETPRFPPGAGGLNEGRFFSGVDGITSTQVYIFNALTGTASTVALPSIPAAGDVTGTANRMYVAYYASAGTQTASVSEFDTSTQPFTLLGTVDGGTYPSGMRMFGQLLFVNGVVFDTSNGQLNKVADLGNDTPLDLSSTNQLLVQPGEEFRVDIVDLSTPSHPVPVGSISPLTYESTVRWAQNYILSAEGFGGMGVYLAAPVGGPFPHGTIALGQVQVNALTASPPYVYSGAVDGYGNGVIGISNVSTGAYLLGSYTVPSDPPQVLEAAGNYLYIGGQISLTILDISTPAAPSKVSALALPTASLALSGNTLFAGTQDSALTVVDVTQPGTPKVVGRLPLPDVARTLLVMGNLLLAADNSGGFLVVDIASPRSPVIVSQTPFSSLVMDVAVDGNLALLAEGDGGLAILDLTNPASPALRSETPLEVFNTTQTSGSLAPFAVEIVTQDQVAYLASACGGGAVFGFDYREPTHPRLVSLAGYGDEILDSVGPLLFFGSDLLIANSSFDYSRPRNVIVQHLAPQGLRIPPESCLTLIADM
jgi:uncharacterized protein (TIGR03437 family)